MGLTEEPAHRSAGAALGDRTFLSVAVTENGAARPLVDGTRIRLSFVGDRGFFRAHAGCNTLSGSLMINDTDFKLVKLATTLMGCDEARHAQDTWLAAVLRARPFYELVGDTLTLRADTRTIVLIDRRVADPDRPL